MVAYSFKKGFIEPIQSGRKQQTVRHQGGKRHARPGEPIQIYTGMRTKACRKIISPDPICTRVDEIRIDVEGMAKGDLDECVKINGIPLSNEELCSFCLADGFDNVTAFVRFWGITHGCKPFEGVIVHWLPAEKGGAA